jgi:pantoate kinase
MIFADGSAGAGVNLNRGAETVVSLCDDGRQEISVAINGSDLEAPVSRAVLKAFLPEVGNRSVNVTTTTAFPVGYGLGMSGAGSFSLSLALNQVLGAKLSYHECMSIAAAAEIACGTGLGSVMNQQYAGFLIGDQPYPSRSSTQHPCAEDTVVCGFLNPIATGSIIRDGGWKDKINTIGGRCMEEIRANPSLPHFIELARHFTTATGLASPAVSAILSAVPEASMAMLGETVFAVCKADDAPRIESTLRPLVASVTISGLATRGAHLI